MLLVNMFHLCLDLIDYVRYSAEFNVYKANWVPPQNHQKLREGRKMLGLALWSIISDLNAWCINIRLI